MKKIVYIDCDGTLKNDKGEISARTKRAIKKFTKAGNYIVLCTGQPRYFAEKIIEALNKANDNAIREGSTICHVVEVLPLG